MQESVVFQERVLNEQVIRLEALRIVLDAENLPEGYPLQLSLLMESAEKVEKWIKTGEKPTNTDK